MAVVFEDLMSSRIFLVIGFLFCSTTLFCPQGDLPPEVSEFIENAKTKLAEFLAREAILQTDEDTDFQRGTIADALRGNDVSFADLAILRFNSDTEFWKIRYLF